MIAVLILVLAGWMHVAEQPVCRNAATASYVDVRCTAEELRKQSEPRS